MRILQLAPPWLAVPPAGYGGTEWVVSALADGLVAAGHDVTLLASGGSRTTARLQTVFEDPPFDRLGDPWVETMQALAGYRDRRTYDVIHDHTGTAGPALASVVEGTPTVHTLHRPWTDSQRLLAQAVSPPVHLVAISHDQSQDAPPGVSVAGVVHNGVLLARYSLVEKKQNFLLFVGRAHPEKGPQVAVEVARRLGRPLVMAIKVNEPIEKAYWDEVLEPLCRELDVEVHFEPGHKEKVDLMGHAAALLAPIQWREPFGMVIPEANACGTPVVAFARGAAPELIVHGQTGFLVPPGDVDGFCAATDRVGDIEPARCRSHVGEYFSAEKMVAGYEEIYQSVL
jgi:glycosyltransferase involved in cell wall biosynthesis